MTWLRRLGAEPLIQFLVIGAVLFAGYELLRGRETAENAPETIVVSEGRITQLADIFARTWQRPPTADELQSLVDGFVKEDVYYREGRKLGLDVDDTVLRRRIQQKMEFLIEPSEAELTPDAAALATFLAAHSEQYRLPVQIALTQVYFDPDRPSAESDARNALVRLSGADAPALDTLGDPTMLPSAMPLTSAPRIAGTFGTDFTDAIEDVPAGAWNGPIRSAFGWHLVRVDVREPARTPDLDEIAQLVSRDWQDDRRRAIAESRFTDIRSRYTVVVAPFPDMKAADLSSGAAAQ